jgi:hypothetical protein
MFSSPHPSSWPLSISSRRFGIYQKVNRTTSPIIFYLDAVVTADMCVSLQFCSFK